MSSSTALLPKKDRKDDHPIFLRVCHSPWAAINQSVLMSVRGFIAIYMTIVFLMILDYEIKHVEHGWMIVFELSNISYFLQVIYSWISFSWTFMHLNYPHHGSAAPSHATRLQWFFSPPRQCQTTKNRVFFSIFHTASMNYPHVVTLVHWLIIHPHKHFEGNELFGNGWFRPFIILNVFATNSIIALFDIFFLSSIRRQNPVWAHVVGLVMLSNIYVGWAYIGKLVTGKYVYYFLDPDKIGWEYVLAAIVSFSALSNVFFAVTYGLTGIREMLTSKVEDKSSGYSRLPQ